MPVYYTTSIKRGRARSKKHRELEKKYSHLSYNKRQTVVSKKMKFI